MGSGEGGSGGGGGGLGRVEEREELPNGIVLPLTKCYVSTCAEGEAPCYAWSCPRRAVRCCSFPFPFLFVSFLFSLFPFGFCECCANAPFVYSKNQASAV